MEIIASVVAEFQNNEGREREKKKENARARFPTPVEL